MAEASLPRRKIQEALQLFSEIEAVDVFDTGDLDRLSLASAPAGASGAPPTQPRSGRGSATAGSTVPRGGMPLQGRRSQSQVPSRRGAATPDGKASAAVTRAHATQEVIIKKLHERNKQLAAQVDALQKQLAQRGDGDPTPPPVVPAPPAASAPDRRRTSAAVPTKCVAVMTDPVAADPAPMATAAAAPSGPSPRSGVHSHADAALRHKALQLQRQLEQAQEARLECIAAGAATGIVNKEVKAYFVSTRQKVVDDAAHLEAERLHWNAELYRLEGLLCDRECGAL